MSNISEKLEKIQSGLKAPKSQRNNFGKYSYRSNEDILEALKPHLKETGVYVNLSDSIELVGNRIYVKAVARICDGKDFIESTAFAREPEQQKGMNEAQITGSASSYARKYALNGLFAIDDNKDADDNSQHSNFIAPNKISNQQMQELATLIQDTQSDLIKFNKSFAIQTLSELQIKDFQRAKAMLLSKVKKQSQA